MKTKFRMISVLFFVMTLSISLIDGCRSGKGNIIYLGTPFTDSVYKSGVQLIPGKLQCEYYDIGGEGLHIMIAILLIRGAAI